MENYAYIDGQNLHMSIKSLGWSLDYAKFFKYLQAKYNVSKAYIFLGYLPAMGSLYTMLQNCGYTVIFKPTLQNKGVTKGNCDAELVLRCMIDYDAFDKAIIVSNDGDFHCLIEHLEQNDKLLKLITPNRKYSSLLRKFAPHIVSLPDFRGKVEKT